MKRAIMIGEQVYLRPLERQDIDGGWQDWINDAATRQNLISPWPQTRENLERYWESSQPTSTVMFAICRVSDDQYIGNARLSSIDWIHRTAQYGRLIGPQFQKQGLGSEALVLLLRYGFHEIGLNRIWSTAWADNTVSLASNEKIGMRREGVMRQAVFKHGRFHDTVILAMTRNDFDKFYGSDEGE